MAALRSGVHVIVTLGAERYALPVEHVLEVVRPDGLTPVPGARAAVLGVCDVRGQIVPVLDLGALLGVAEARRRPIVVVVGDAGRRGGLACDAVIELERLGEIGRETTSDLVVGEAVSGETLVGVVDVPRLLEALGRS